MSIVAASLIGAGASILGSALGADAEIDAADSAAQIQRESRDIALKLAAPQLAVGNQALATLGGIFGFTTPQLGGPSVLGPNFDPNNLSGDQAAVLKDFKRRFQATPFEDGRSGHVFKAPSALTSRAQKSRDDFQEAFGFDPFKTSLDDHLGGFEQPAATQPGALNLNDLVTNNPLIQFTRQQGEDAIGRGAAARGLNQSGNTLKDLAEFNQGVSTRGVHDFVLNPLFELAGFGSRGSAQASGVVTNSGTNLSNLALGAGQSRSSAFQNAGNVVGNSINDIGSMMFLRDALRSNA